MPTSLGKVIQALLTKMVELAIFNALVWSFTALAIPRLGTAPQN